MRLLKTLMIALIAVLALTAGVVVTAVVAVVGAAVFFGRRLLRPAPKQPSMTAPPTPSARSAGGGEIIDVTATEVR